MDVQVKAGSLVRTITEHENSSLIGKVLFEALRKNEGQHLAILA